MTYVSVANGVNSSLVFSVQGTQTLAMAQMYANAVQGLSKQHYMDLSSQAGAAQGGAPGSSVTEYILQSGATASAAVATIPGGSGNTSTYVLDSWAGPNTLTGSGTGDNVFVGTNTTQSGTGAATYLDQGGNNIIVFIDGNNVYDGSSTAASGNNFIVAGQGYDVIKTGTGNDTINSGTGLSAIFLNDAATVSGSGTTNDHVWLDDGTSYVFAGGASDGIVASSATGHETIVGGTGGNEQYLNIVLNAGVNGLTATSATNDVVGLGQATTTLYDFTSGNVIYGGTGDLAFLAGAGITASVNAGTHNNVIFGNAGDTLSIYTPTGTVNNNVVVAGTGNETLNGGNSAGNQIFWAFQNTATDTGTYNESITGGFGNDTFVTGTGNETINSGGATNLFVIHNDTADASATSNVLINDFGANAANHVQFWGFDQTEVQQALDNAQVISGPGGTPEVIIQLGSSATVTFVGVNSLNGHIG